MAEVKQKRPAGDGWQDSRGYVHFRVGGRAGRKIRLHVLLAEKALGKKLPSGAVVHHADGDPSNNQGDNLVICPSADYHALLHRRMRALEECGHADWRKCRYCKQYDTPENLLVYEYPGSGGGAKVYHRACDNAHQRRKYAALKEEQ